MRLKFWIFIFVLVGFMSLVFADKYENSNLKVTADVKEPFARIEISPDEVYLGETTRGYTTEAVKIEVVNLGTIDISIKPMLKAGANSLFENLVFSSTATCASNSTCIRIGNYSTSIAKSGKYGSDFKTRSFYLKLDLRDYNFNGNIEQDYNLSTNVIFWVMPA
jgi:hypothetical protein